MSKLAFKQAEKPAIKRLPPFIIDYDDLDDFEQWIRQPGLDEDVAFAESNPLAFKNALYAAIDERKNSEDMVVSYEYHASQQSVGFYFIADINTIAKRADARQQLQETIESFIESQESQHE